MKLTVSVNNIKHSMKYGGLNKITFFSNRRNETQMSFGHPIYQSTTIIFLFQRTFKPGLSNRLTLLELVIFINYLLIQ